MILVTDYFILILSIIVHATINEKKNEDNKLILEEKAWRKSKALW